MTLSSSEKDDSIHAKNLENYKLSSQKIDKMYAFENQIASYFTEFSFKFVFIERFWMKSLFFSCISPDIHMSTCQQQSQLRYVCLHSLHITVASA